MCSSYTEYLVYLDWRCEMGWISKNKHSLLKLSKSEYDNFLLRMDNDDFRDHIKRMSISINRNNKIDEILK
jgi:hypothetical protein